MTTPGNDISQFGWLNLPKQSTKQEIAHTRLKLKAWGVNTVTVWL